MNLEQQTMGQSTLIKGFLVYVPGQHEQAFRPYETGMTGQAITDLMNNTNGGKDLSAVNLSTVASGIIHPSAVIGGVNQIANGYGADRLAFYLEIQTKNGLFHNSREVLCGFTDHVGVSAAGNLDPNMRFFLNSISKLKVSDDNGQGNSRMVDMGNYQVYSQMQQTESSHLMRPEDVISEIQTTGLEEEGGISNIINSYNSNGVSGKLSERRNVMGNHYLDKLINGSLYELSKHSISGQGIEDLDTGFGDIGTHNPGDSDFGDTLGRGVHSQSLVNTEAYNSLSKHSEQGQGHIFTMASLEALWPGCSKFMQVIMPKPSARPLSAMEHTAGWTDGTLETVVAYSITHALPALMTSLKLIEFSFVLTNETNNALGEPQVVITSAIPMFEGGATPQVIRYLENQILMNVKLGILESNPTIDRYRVQALCNLVSVADYQISLNGDHPVPKQAPMFCDSYYAPVQTSDQNQLRAIATDTMNLVSEIHENLTQPQQIISTSTGTTGGNVW